MPSNETAALVVALSAQVSKFEKDMQGAVDIAQRRTKDIEDTFTRLNGTITNKLQATTQGFVGNLGFAGQLLTALGPAGVAAAAGIGVAVGAMYFLADATAQFAEKSKVLKETSETAGLTIAQMKLLGGAGKSVGLDFEETSAFFTKYIANLEALRNGGGPLYDALLKIDVGLLRQLSTTKDSAQAIDSLIKAYAKLEDQTSKLNLARAAGGRAGLSGGRLLDSMSKNGGMAAIDEKASTQTAKDFADATERAAGLSKEISAIKAKANGIWGSMFSDAQLNAQKETAELMLEIAEAVDRISKGKFPKPERSVSGGYDAMGNFTGMDAPDSRDDFKSRFAGDGSNPGLKPYTRPDTKTDDDAAANNEQKASLSVELALLQSRTAVLGNAVTQSEQYRLKQLEVAVAVEKNAGLSGVADRALAAFNLTLRVAALATRERLGIATEQEVIDVKLAQLAQDRTRYGLKENEVQAATVVILREAKQAAEQLQVRNAYLPGLKQLEIDAKNVGKNLDGVLSAGLNTMTDDLASLVTGTKTAKEAFSDMAKSILNDIVKLSIRQAITGPLAGALGGLFGSGAGGINFGGPVPLRADGGPISGPGGPRSDSILAWLSDGEFLMNAPATKKFRPMLEAMNRGRLPMFADGGMVPEGAPIVPNDVLRPGGGTSVTIGSTQIVVQGDASERTLALMEAKLRQRDAEFHMKVVSSVRRAQSGRML